MVSQRHGSEDPDPHQNFVDPQHWQSLMKTYVVVIVLDENARQGVEDPESSVGPVSAQTVHVHLRQEGRRETLYWCKEAI